MYTVSDAVEMGRAHELILCLIKELPFTIDDTCDYSERDEERFDE